MNIALIGFGKMGQEIAKCCDEHQIKLIIDPGQEDAPSIEEADFTGVDVAIDFTNPDVCLNNIQVLAKKGINTVVGTTGWYNHLDEVKAIIEKAGTGFLWSSNFSIGVHLFWKMLAHNTEIMNQFEEYDVSGHEWHHKQKLDAPSGTAITTAKIITNHLDRKEELEFTSTREGEIPGTHTVTFESPTDAIEITHRAKNRSGFAQGAVRCAEWLVEKKGFYSIEDYLNEIL